MKVKNGKIDKMKLFSQKILNKFSLMTSITYYLFLDKFSFAPRQALFLAVSFLVIIRKFLIASVAAVYGMLWTAPRLLLSLLISKLLL